MPDRRMSILTAWIAVTVLLLVTTLTGEEREIAAAAAAEPTPAEKAIQKALRHQKVSLNFRDERLSEIIAHLREQTNLTITLDEQALDEIGLDPDSEATIRIAEVTLRSALQLLFRKIDPTLSYNIRDEALEITTWEGADEHLSTRVYNVHGLLTVQEAHVFEGVFQLDDAEKPPATIEDPEMLIELITRTVEPENWEEVGGIGSITSFENSLIVSQTQTTHEKVAGLLDVLRTIRTIPLKQLQNGHAAALQVGVSAAELEALESIQQALDKPIEFDFDDARLDEVVRFLQKAAKISVYLDTTALDEVGIESDAKVTLQTRARSLRSALRHLLRKIDPTLTYTAQHEVLMITTREACEENQIVMVYPVLDLVMPNSARGWDRATHDYDSLIELISTTVEPDSWDEVGGPGSIAEYAPCGALVFAQTMEVHDKIAALLKELRAKRRVAPKKAAPKAAPKAVHKPANKDEYVIAVYHLDEWDRPEKDVPVRPLVDMIQEMIEPNSWQSDEVSIRILANRLVIRQKRAIHKEIYELLMKMDVLMEDAGFQGQRSSLVPQRRRQFGGLGGGGF